MVKASELMDKSVEELEASLQDLSMELFHLINEYNVNKKLDQPHRLKSLRRDKARYHTVINQKRESNKR